VTHFCNSAGFFGIPELGGTYLPWWFFSSTAWSPATGQSGQLAKLRTLLLGLDLFHRALFLITPYYLIYLMLFIF
jgi:hypothetical protein